MKYRHAEFWLILCVTVYIAIVVLAKEGEICEDDCCHCLYDDRAAQCVADIMTTLNFKSVHFASLEVESLLSTTDARCWFECYSEYDRSTIGQTTIHSACTILNRTRIRTDRIIMLRASHGSSLETISELYTANSRDCKHGMCNL